MGNVINMREYRERNDWSSVFTAVGASSTLHAYVNKQTGEVEIIQVNSNGEAIRTLLSFRDTVMLLSTVSLTVEKSLNKGKAK